MVHFISELDRADGLLDFNKDLTAEIKEKYENKLQYLVGTKKTLCPHELSECIKDYRGELSTQLYSLVIIEEGVDTYFEALRSVYLLGAGEFMDSFDTACNQLKQKAARSMAVVSSHGNLKNNERC